MRERPILFSGPMIQALLAGTKTQTRRALKPQPAGKFLGLLKRPMRSEQDPPVLRAWFQGGPDDRSSIEVTCPYGEPGDRLWVRESWAYGVHAMAAAHDEDGPFVYAADGTTQGRLCYRWRPSIHMPRAASRLTLELTKVRVEQLQDISVADAIAEGAQPLPPDPACSQVCPEDYVAGYRAIWEQINGRGSWDANPWVWALSFRVIQGAAL